MIEGWYGDDYLIVFDEAETASASDRYAISQLLPGYEVIGLCGWDDFILRSSAGQIYCAPTIPLNLQRLSPFALPVDLQSLQQDERFRAKIKWYVKPIAFGGDAKLGENVIWVSHEQHGELVKWWNSRYASLKAQVSSDH
jgi:hypothetical protein